MTDPPATHDGLLFAILSYQLGFISQDQFFGIVRDWLGDKSTSLADLLIAEGMIDVAERDLIDQLVQAHQDRNNVDPDGRGTPDGPGLIFNSLNGSILSQEVDLDEGIRNNIHPVEDPTQWQEFWITIKKDTSFFSTHKVKVYHNGATQPAVGKMQYPFT